LPRSRLLVPVVSLAAALAAGPMLPAVTFAADPVVVRRGDTLTAISKRHDVPIARIVELNDLVNANRIFVGQRLRLTDGLPASASPTTPTAPAGSARAHTVRAGETLTHIAARYGVTIGAIARANGLADPSRIYAGQRLTIPGSGSGSAAPSPSPASPPSAAPSAPPGSARSHTVRAGETLTHIAIRYGVTIRAIAKANGIADPSRIYAGQRLTIPGSGSGSAAPAPSVPAAMAALMQRRDQVRRVIVQEAERYDVPVALALAVGWQESGWQQGVVSRAGAIGVMQILPATGEWVGEVMLRRSVDLTDLRQNVRVGVRLLAHYLDRYDGNIDLVLAAYYQGQTAADRHGVYAVSRPYIASIKALIRLFGG
jgi:LysM repeat protein